MYYHPQVDWLKGMAAAVGAGLILVFLWGIGLTGWRGSEQLQFLLDVMAILLAAVSGILALMHFYGYSGYSFLLVLGLGLIGTAMLDAGHIVSLTEGLTHSPPLTQGADIFQGWIVARQYFALLLLLSWLACWYESHDRPASHRFDVSSYLVAGGLLLLSLLWLVFAKVQLSPQQLDRWQLGIALLLTLSLLGYLYGSKKQFRQLEVWLSLSLLFSLTSQLLLMFLFEPSVDAGLSSALLLNNFSYLLIFCGLILDMRQSFRNTQRDCQWRDSILSTAQDGIFTLNERACIDYANPGFERLFGYSAKELVGKPLKLLVPELDIHHGGLMQQLSLTSAYRHELEGLHKAGARMPLELAIAESTQGRLRVISGTVREISRHRDRVEELTQTSERLSLAIKAGAIGVWDYDLSNDALRWDEQMYSIYHLDREEFADPKRAWGEAVHPEDLPEARAMMDEAIVDAKEFVNEFRILWPDETVRYIRAVGTVIRDRLGQAERIVGVNWDITEHHQVMQALERARQEADAANAAKSAFLATMSHEIRTPMNGVISMAEILTHSQLNPQQNELAQTIEQSAATLLSLIDDILDFSKIEAGQLDISLMPTVIEDLVEGLCESLAAVAAAKSVRLSLFISPLIPARVLADDVRLRQILYNLVGNAIKFCANMPDRESRVEVRVDIKSSDPLQLLFTVADNGIGMRQQTLSKLFMPFTQANIGITRCFGGTGLGLAICKRLVNLLHGKIVVSSSPGVGSCFSVTLPFELAREQPPIKLPDFAGLNCILISSCGYNSRDLCAYLENVGARVQLASCLDSAINLVSILKGSPVMVHGSDIARDQLLSRQHVDPALPCLQVGEIAPGGEDAGGELGIPIGHVLRRRVFLNAIARVAGLAGMEADKPVAAAPAAVITALPAAAQGHLILVAEDDKTNRKVIKQQFSLLGYVCEVVNDGAQALRRWREQRFSLLITDLHMPEMDGYALARAIRQEEAGADPIPIIALTANALRGEASKAKAAGISSYLTKPLSLSDLGDELNKWLAQPPAVENKEECDQKVQDGLAVLDVRQLQDVIGDDADTMLEFLRDYQGSLISHAKHLGSGEKSEMKVVASVAHQLKSSSRAVGAQLMAENCEKLELAAKTGNSKQLALELRSFEDNRQQLEVALQRLLQQPRRLQ
jgi:PAS domain S-box-containing protein